MTETIEIHTAQNSMITVELDTMDDHTRLEYLVTAPDSMKNIGDAGEFNKELFEFFVNIIVQETSLDESLVDRLPMSESLRLAVAGAQLVGGQEINIPPSQFDNSNDFEVDNETDVIEFDDGIVDLEDWR